MRKTLALAGVAGLLALAACGSKAEPAQPAGKSSTPVASTAGNGAPTLGPAGHQVALGATEAEVKAAGWTVTPNPIPGLDKDCPKVAALHLDGGDAYLSISTKLGVSVINGNGDMATPEGIRIRSSLADLTKAYPQITMTAAETSSSKDAEIPVPGSSTASYKFTVLDSVVLGLTLKLNDNTC